MAIRAKAALSILFWFSFQALAQQDSARLIGIVQSQSGTPLAAATLTVESTDNGLQRTVETGVDGRYEVRGILPGTYTLRVSLPGFLPQLRQEVELVPGQTTEQDFRLEQEGASGAQISASSVVIDQEQLVGLPMNGRSYSQLATLQAGVSDPFGGGGQGSIRGGLTVSGGRRDWNSFLMDGTNINGTENRVPRSAAGGQLGADALLRIQVFSTTYGAQHGRAAGGVISATSRSGSNEWHGTAFEFLRNSKLDARNFFDKGSEPPPFKRNQFGGTLTGPIVRENSFFMLSFEALLNRLTETKISFVPDDSVRQGTLSLPGETISVEPRVRPYLLLYPSADFPLLDKEGRPTGVAENRTEVSQPSSEYFFVVRVDQRLGDRDAWFVRYTFDDANTHRFQTPIFLRVDESRQQYLTLAETHFFSPSLLNTVRLSYTRPVVESRNVATIEIPEKLNFVPGALQFGRITVPGLMRLGSGGQLPNGKIMNSFQFANDVVNRRGAHSLQFGMLVDRYQWNVYESTFMGGQWNFNGLRNFLTLERESFLQGATRGSTDLRVTLPGSIRDRALRQTLFAFYVQDDYKIRRNLTFNLGLRYEFTTMIHDLRGRTVFLEDELRDPAPRIGNWMKVNRSLLNFAPRVGLSWSPDSNADTVVRAGFGIFHDQIIEYGVDSKRSTIPFFLVAVEPNLLSFTSFPDAVRLPEPRISSGSSNTRTQRYPRSIAITFLSKERCFRGSRCKLPMWEPAATICCGALNQT